MSKQNNDASSELATKLAETESRGASDSGQQVNPGEAIAGDGRVVKMGWER